MTLKEHIDDIRRRLEQKIFKSETAVRQGIVDPLLRRLGWPTDDTQIVFPEYPVGDGWVDYALCHPPSTPRVFIEAKQVGNIKGAEEQLFGYDSRIRVPVAVLTDGQQWRFFHPQKPLALYELLISASSNEGDIVLDPFCGCGTTIDAAHSLKRNWKGVGKPFSRIIACERFKIVYSPDKFRLLPTQYLPTSRRSVPLLKLDS